VHIGTTSVNSPTAIAIVVGAVVIGRFAALRVRNGMQPTWRNTLLSWAKKNDFELSTVKFVIWNKGPFSWTTVTSQGVYYIIVTDKSGNQRRGWVRVSNWLNGNVDSNVEIHWDN
jgi:hypothetical protein